MKTLSLIFGLSLVFVSECFSQNIETSTIEWNCSSTFDVQTGTINDDATRIVSSANQITWYDDQGVAKETLQVTGHEGSWSNVSNNGSIIFKVISGNYSGIAQFSKANGVMRVRIQMVLDDEVPIYELTVNEINQL